MKSVVKPVLVVFGVTFALALWCAPTALAQCAMCRAAAAAAGNDALNTAILVLLIPPVMIFCAIFIIAYRMRK